MGGFTSTAPILAGRSRKIPTFVHESNAIPGKANKLNARLVTRVLLGFEECAQHFPAGKCDVTGTPIRTSLVDAPATRRRRSPLSASRRAGRRCSSWAAARARTASIRRCINALPQLAGTPLQVIHLTGQAGRDRLMRESYAKAGIPAFVAAFHHRMEEAYSAADFAIARSGAASLTELSHFALPSILIPYPFAAEDHQTFNAKIFERAGAATLLKERETTRRNSREKAALVSRRSGPAFRDVCHAARASRRKQAAERVADTRFSTSCS